MFRKAFLIVGSWMVLLGGSAGAVELQLKWQEGKSYTFSVDSATGMTMAMGGNQIASESEMTQKVRYDAAAHEKGTQVTMQIESMTMLMRMNGQAMMNYDSTKDAGGGMLGKSMKPLLDLKALAVYDEDGKVVEIGGLEDLEGMEQVGMGKEQLEMMIKESSLMMPDGDVKPGDTWQAQIELPMKPLSEKPALIVFDLKFEGMEEKDGNSLARISLTGKVAMEADAETPLKLESKSVKGEMLFDPELGQPRESLMEMELEMGVPANVPLAEGAPGKMPMSIKTTQKLLSVEETKKEE